MAKAKSAVPEGLHTITAQLTLDNAVEAIDWYKKASQLTNQDTGQNTASLQASTNGRRANEGNCCSVFPSAPCTAFSTTPSQDFVRARQQFVTSRAIQVAVNACDSSNNEYIFFSIRSRMSVPAPVRFE